MGTEGNLSVICGCMFAGKTEELIRQIKRANAAGQTFEVFKPLIDNRYKNAEDYIVSHNETMYDAVAVDHREPGELMNYVMPDTDIVFIDEIQFFDYGIVKVINELNSRGHSVVASGLDLNFRGEPFGIIANILCLAEDITKKKAHCSVCDKPATRTQRLVNGEPAHYDDPEVVVGAAERYEARCREHHEVPKGEVSHENRTVPSDTR